MATIKVRRDTSSDWASADPVLAQGEPGYELNKYKLKIGDGSTAWSVLNYFGEDPLTFNPTQARQYTGATAGGRQGYRPLISGTRNIIDNGGDHTLKIYTASTGVIERTITSPNAGDGNYYGFAEKGAVAADDTFVVTSENYQTPATNSRLRIYKVSDGTMVGTLLRATVANDSSDNTVDGMTFGRVMSIKDSYLLVSNTEYSASASGAGVVHVYKTANGTWSDIALEGSIAPAGPVVDGNYGCSLDMHGDFGVIGHRGNSSGTVDIVNVSTRALVATIAHPAGGSSNELFGNTVKFIGRDGQYIAVGAPGQSASAGSVYIFKTTDGTWTDGSLVSTINNPNAYNDSAGDQFGLDLASTSKYLTIAASHEDNQVVAGAAWTINSTTTVDNPTSGNNDQWGSTIDTGSLYSVIADRNTGQQVHVIDNSNGSLVRTFTETNGIGGYWGGYNGAAGTDTHVAIGDENDKVTVYNISNGSTAFTGYANQIGGLNTSKWAAKITMNSTHVFVTDYGTQRGATASGGVWAYEISSGNRTEINRPGGDIAGREFGGSIACNDSYLVVGSLGVREHFILDASTFSLIATISPPHSSVGSFNSPVVTDDYVALGAPGENKVYVYNASNGSLVRSVANPGASTSLFGANDSLGISGDYLAVGDAGAASNEGKVYIFDLTDGSLLQTVNSVSQSGSGSDGFGSAVGYNGSTLVIGQYSYNDSQTDSGRAYIIDGGVQAPSGVEAGVNYIYSTTTGDWTDTALATTLKNPDLTNGGGDGLTAVDMYADRMLAGYTLAEDGSTTNVGRVYEYSLYD